MLDHHFKSAQKNILLFLPIFLIASPLWVPIVEKNFKSGLWLLPDSLLWLGITLLCGMLAYHVIPDRKLSQVESLFNTTRYRSLLILALLLFSLLASIFVNKNILHGFMNSADEHSCRFLAECIKDGKWYARPHPLQEFFDVTHVGNKNGKWFSVYPPGWPLIYAVGLQFHIQDWINPILALIALFLFLKIGEKVFGFSVSYWGLSLIAFTPFFLFNNASYFSHTTCLLAVAIFLCFYFRWRENRSVMNALICALSIGFGLGTRYLTMASIAAPFILYEIILLYLKRQRWTRSHLVFAITLLAMFVLNLYYNFIITGKFFEAPNHYYHRWERLGFHSDYTFFDALKFIINRMFFLGDWFPPFLIVLFIASLFQKGKRSPEEWLVRFAFFYPVIGYVFYYSWGGNQYGPRYYFEGLPFFAFTLADGIKTFWKSGDLSKRKFLIGALTCALIGNAYLLFKQGDFCNQMSSQRKALYDLADATLKKPSIVFIRGFLGSKLVMAEEDAVRNSPDLSGRILYAHDLGEKNIELTEYYPERQFFLGSYDAKQKSANVTPYPVQKQ